MGLSRYLMSSMPLRLRDIYMIETSKNLLSKFLIYLSNLVQVYYKCGALEYHTWYSDFKIFPDNLLYFQIMTANVGRYLQPVLHCNQSRLIM